MKVLVADDDKTTRNLLRKMIASWGYTVVTASDGDEAWRILNERDPPLIAILDWMMPGKTGVEICSACQEKNMVVYRILVTVKDRDQDLMDGLDHGAHDFQSKPVMPGILKSRLAVGKRAMTNILDMARQERLAAVGLLVAGIAHHFNNLNTPILMYASCLLQEENLSTDIKDKLETIVKAAQQAGHLTEQLLAIASDRRTEKICADLNQLINEMTDIESIAMAKEYIQLEKVLAPIPAVCIHESDIRLVIMNLLKNACDALVERLEKHITIRTGVSRGKVFMAVSDTGCGIAADKLTQIFSLFYTAKGAFAEPGSPLHRLKGVGIGLYASKMIAGEHGGDIMVNSELGKGSIFTLWLPAHGDGEIC